MKKRIAVAVISAGLAFGSRPPLTLEEAGVGATFTVRDDTHITVVCFENYGATVTSTEDVTLRPHHDVLGSCPGSNWHWALTDKGKLFIYGPFQSEDQIQLVY